jgi:hypothetical protein
MANRFLVLAALLLSACQGGKGEGTPGSIRFPPGLRPEQTVGEIGVRQFANLCSTFDDWMVLQHYERLYADACMSWAVQNNTMKPECDSFLAECLAEQDANVDGWVTQILSQARCTVVSEYSECSTVLQIETCLEALEAGIEMAGFELTCDQVGQFDGSWWRIDYPEECLSDALACEGTDPPDAGPVPFTVAD